MSVRSASAVPRRHVLGRCLKVIVALAVVFGLIAMPAVAADNSPPATAASLKTEQTGSLPGGSGGHFAYYKFSYPGGWPVRLELWPYTDDKNVLQYVGLRVYGPQPDREYVGAKLDNGTWQGAAELFVPDRGEFVVQVYNYYPDPTWALGYTLLATGLPPQPGEDPPAVPPPGTAGHVAIPAEGVHTGRLAPSDGVGQFRYYSFYAARERSVTVSLQVTPDEDAVLALAGFKLYGPQHGREYLQSEARVRQTPNQTGTLWVEQDGLYVVQLYNYNRNLAVDYRLWVTPPD